jgi:2-polyprenyl-6-methoxyphenol hydroxylase-like FAD-dependent oxidoreductase
MPPQVLIVGAGPVGLTLAIELTRYGVAVRIVDKAPTRTDKSKALVLWSRTLELLERGPGSARFIDAGFKVNAVNMVSGDKLIGHVDMASIDSPHNYALMIPQADTERLLEEHLRELGVKVERSVEVTALSVGDKSVEAVLRRADGSQETLSAAWLAGCDGAHSVVRHSVRATFDGETNNGDWILADIHMRGYPSPDTEASVYWDKEGVFVIFPISPGRYRLIADVPASAAEHPLAPTMDQVQALMDRRGPSRMKGYDPIWLAGFRINGRKVSSYRWGRAFLVGDAAHVHSPAGGQGMNTGMQDAFNLAWKFASVIQGSCAESILDSYSAERSAVGEEVLKAAGRLTTIGTLRNPVLQTIRNAVAHAVLGLAPARQAFADNMSELSIGYPRSPLNGVAHTEDGPKPGQRLAPIEGRKPIGSGGTPRFALMAVPSPEISQLLARFSKVLDPELCPPGPLHGTWLVRPDGYIACSSTQSEDIARYLSGLAIA